jgi:hypothetical protein
MVIVMIGSFRRGEQGSVAACSRTAPQSTTCAASRNTLSLLLTTARDALCRVPERRLAPLPQAANDGPHSEASVSFGILNRIAVAIIGGWRERPTAGAHGSAVAAARHRAAFHTTIEGTTNGDSGIHQCLV